MKKKLHCYIKYKVQSRLAYTFRKIQIKLIIVMHNAGLLKIWKYLEFDNLCKEKLEKKN